MIGHAYLAWPLWFYTVGVAGHPRTARTAATIDWLRLIIRRECAWLDERDNILTAAKALGIDPAHPDVNHPLADLYRALHLSVANNGVIYLSREHCRLLPKTIHRLGRHK